MKRILCFWLLMSVMILSLLLGCSKNKIETNACTAQVNPIVINFNVLDRTTNQDLYFSINPRFQTKYLYFFKKKDLSRKDTIRPTVIVAGSSRSFQYHCDYASFKDTLILRTGNMFDNTLTYTIEKTEGFCTNYKLSTVGFNGSILALSSDKYIFLE